MQFSVPVGLMRVGRMPSHWGMGLLANGGGTGWIDPDIAQGRAHAQDRRQLLRRRLRRQPLRLDRRSHPVRHPPHHHLPDGEEAGQGRAPADRRLRLRQAERVAAARRSRAFERKFRPFGQQGFISRGRSDDVNEHVALAVWNDPDWDKKSFLDELKLGFYGVMRTAKEGSTNPSDPRLATPPPTAASPRPSPASTPAARSTSPTSGGAIRYGSLFTEGEAYAHLRRDLRRRAVPQRATTKKEASINAGVARFAWLTPKWDAMLEVGHASGDEDLGRRQVQAARHAPRLQRRPHPVRGDAARADVAHLRHPVLLQRRTRRASPGSCRTAA